MMTQHNTKRTAITRSIRQLTATALLIVGAPLALARPELLDQVIAIVDDDVVLASELDNRVQQVLFNIKKQGKTAPPMAELKRQLLDQLILENIQMQMAYRAGVRISDAQLNDAMLRVAQQNGMTLVDFKETLEREGMSYADTRDQIQKEMMLQKVQQGSVNRQVQITEQEITNFLASKEGQSLTSPEYRMLHTLVPVRGSDKAADAKARQYANDLYQRISNGESYEQVVSSSNKMQLTGSDLGWRKSADLPGLIAGLTATLAKGETAAPIHSASGYHLVKLVDKRGAGQVIPQTKARHILLKPSAIRDDAATEKEIKSLRQRILAGEDFAELARQHSEDIGSAQEGGELGWTSPGQLVQAFQDSMDNTDINGVSTAFRSQYGWHILQILERRQKDVTDNIRKKIASNYIHQRKFDDELQTWLQKIRDEAYVDIK